MPSSTKSQAFRAINPAYAGAAERLLDLDYSPVPLSQKRPRIVEWDRHFCDNRPLTDDISKWSKAFRGGIKFDGVGVATHGGLIIIDNDGADAQPAAAVMSQLRHCGIDTDSGPACIGRRGIKLFIRSEDGLNRRADNIWSAETGGLVEVLAWHRQGVIPPTVHPATGQPYNWRDPSTTLLNTPLDKLPVLRNDALTSLRHEFGVTAVSPSAPRLSKDDPRFRSADGKVEYWDGTQAHLEKVASALCAISNTLVRQTDRRLVLPPSAGYTQGTIVDWSQRKWWLIVGLCLGLWGRLAPAVFNLWVAASRGDDQLGLVACPEKFDMTDQAETWDGLHDPYTVVSRAAQNQTRLRTMRSIYWLATHFCGWSGNGRQYAVSGPVGGVSAGPVHEAGKRAVDAGLVQFRSGLLEHARRHLTPSQYTTLADLAEDCRPAKGGVGSARTEVLMKRWGCPTTDAVLMRLKRLANLGYIASSSARENNSAGHRGVSWTLTPPPGLTYDDVVRRVWNATQALVNGVQIDCSIRSGRYELSSQTEAASPQSGLARPNPCTQYSRPVSPAPAERLTWWLKSDAIPDELVELIAAGLQSPRPPLKSLRSLVEILDLAQASEVPNGTIYAAMEGQVRRALSGRDTLSRTLGYLRTEVVRLVGPDVAANAAAYALMEREEQRRQQHQQRSQHSASQGSPAQVRAEPPANRNAPNAYARAKDPG